MFDFIDFHCEFGLGIQMQQKHVIQNQLQSRDNIAIINIAISIYINRMAGIDVDHDCE